VNAPRKPPLRRIQPVVVAGGAGFIGSNLADRLACEGEHVLVFDSLARPGVERNLAWLKRRHPTYVSVVIGDVRDMGAVGGAARDAAAIFHFAAQVAVTTSLVEPSLDFAVNLAGTFNLLEALRRLDRPVPLIFASTNKVYGDLADIGLVQVDGRFQPSDPALAGSGFDESRPLDFHTPYGCSKGAADQYVLDYARSFGLPTAVMRMSCIYGPRQMGTEDQGWVAHFIKRALAGQPITIYGDGRQVRDVLFVDDAVAGYVAAWRQIARIGGRAFNLGGGPENAISLLELIRHIEYLLDKRIAVSFEPWRAGDQRYYVSDPRAVRRALSLPSPMPWRDGVAALLRWLSSERAMVLPAEAAPGTAFAGEAA
jgi:CDP-paratose 2-epimerase